jgi:hypothetical protein
VENVTVAAEKISARAIGAAMYSAETPTTDAIPFIVEASLPKVLNVSGEKI